MKEIILALLAVFTLSTKATSQTCNCPKNLDSLIKGVEHNYVGFFDKVKNDNLEYPRLKDSLFTKSAKVDDYDCFLLLKKYIQYFKDPHMTISIGSLKGASTDTNAIQGIFKRFKQIPISEDSFKKHIDQYGTDGIEGIWQNASLKYRVAIIKDTATSNGYLGLVLGGDDLYWYNGQIKMEIIPKGGSFSIKYLRNDHYPDTRNVRFEGENMFISGYSSWKMSYPKQKIKSELPKPCEFRKISNEACLISLRTSLEISNKAFIDSVIVANMPTIIRSKYLLIDLRNNGGGSILSCEKLMPLLYTGPAVYDGFTGDISGLYLSATMISDDKNLNDLQKQLKAIEETKTPIYAFMADPENDPKSIPETDTAGSIDLQKRVMPKLMKLFEETNISLLKYLQTRTNPQVISFGLVCYGFDQNIQDKGLMPVIEKLKHYDEDPLAHSIMVRAKDLVQPTDTSFLFKAYPLLNGGNIVMDTISSRFILMDFWASWCLPCRKGIKGEIKQLELNFSKKDLQIIGINKDEQKENARQAIKKDDNKAIQIWDGAGGELSQYFKIEGIPFYVLIDTKTKSVEVLKETFTLEKRLKEILSASN